MATLKIAKRVGLVLVLCGVLTCSVGEEQETSNFLHKHNRLMKWLNFFGNLEAEESENVATGTESPQVAINSVLVDDNTQREAQSLFGQTPIMVQAPGPSRPSRDGVVRDGQTAFQPPTNFPMRPPSFAPSAFQQPSNAPMHQTTP